MTSDRGFAPPGDRRPGGPGYGAGAPGYGTGVPGYGPGGPGYGAGASGSGPGAPGHEIGGDGPSGYRPADRYGPDERGFAPRDSGFAPPPSRQPQYIRCGRCEVLQPLGSAGPARCVSCGARIRRWVAHPPPVDRASRDRTAPRRERPYVGPPSYRGGHPRWSFPPVVWRELPPPDPQLPPRDPAPGLRWAAWLCAATSLCALVAAGAEIWRFALMLEGRK